MNSSSTATGQTAGDSYGSISYASNPFPQSAPDRLFGLARLFEMEPSCVQTARILELGCSSGGNIIPLAVRFPSARFVGVDLAARHVTEANGRIAGLGLTNIEVLQGDIASLDLGNAQFDAIICHGVYSWVSNEARQGILRIAGRHLAPNGVAYISYNVYPGWHLRSIIRDLMLFHAGDEGAAPPAERIAKARWVIENVSKLTNAGSAYGVKLREEATALSKQGDYYIFGEFLVPHNAPSYFRDFLANAEQQGLGFLCEAEVETCLPETYGPEVASLIRTMSANQLLPMEQYIDFCTGRQFRQTLLVRKERAGRVDRHLTPDRIRKLHLSGRLVRDDSERNGAAPYVFKSPAGRTVSTMNTVICVALQHLCDAYPETRTITEIKVALDGAGIAVSLADEQQILEVLFQLVITGIMKVSSNALRLGSWEYPEPVAFSSARADASAGADSTANLRHETTVLDPVMRVLLPCLDGSKGRPELQSILAEAVASGSVSLTSSITGEHLSGIALTNAISEHLDLALRRLASAALLQH